MLRRSDVLAVLGLALFAVAAHAQGPQTLEARDYRPHYWPAQQATAQAVAQAAESSLPRLRSVLGLERTARIEIYLAHTGDEFKLLTGGSDPNRVLGEAFPERRMVVVQPMQGAFLKDLVAHELTHILLADRVGAMEPPRWVHEGVAKYAAEDFNANDRAILTQAINNGTFLPMEKLEAAFDGKPAQVSLAYAEAYTLVDFLARLAPKDGLAPFLQQLGEVGDVSRALLRAYGLTPAEIGRRWQEAVSSEYLGKSNEEMVTPAIWGGMAILFVVVFLLSLRHRSAIRRRMDAEDEGLSHNGHEARQHRRARRHHHRHEP